MVRVEELMVSIIFFRKEIYREFLQEETNFSEWRTEVLSHFFHADQKKPWNSWRTIELQLKPFQLKVQRKKAPEMSKMVVWTNFRSHSSRSPRTEFPCKKMAVFEHPCRRNEAVSTKYIRIWMSRCFNFGDFLAFHLCQDSSKVNKPTVVLDISLQK